MSEATKPAHFQRPRVTANTHTSAATRLSNPAMLTSRFMSPIGPQRRSSESAYTRIPTRSMAVPARMPIQPPIPSSSSLSSIHTHLPSLEVFPWGIKYRNWLFSSFDSRPIAGERELDQIAKETKLVHALPEMVFARNFLRLEYVCSQEYTDMTGDDYKINDQIVSKITRNGKRLNIYFTAKDGLRSCYGSPKQPVLVSQAKKWQNRNSSMDQIETGLWSTKDIDRSMDADYDWTFTTQYSGTYHRVDFVDVECQSSDGEMIAKSLFKEESVPFIKDSPYQLNRSLLMDTSDRILWQCQMCLFEDELHDCGTSELHVRCRVMSRCFLIRMRYFLRVDRVLIRIRDTRLFHEFGQEWMVRNIEWRQVKWSDLASLGLRNDPTNYNSDSIDRFIQSIPIVYSCNEHLDLS